MKEINGKMFKEMVLSGAIVLHNNHPEVDALNVFPVPDGDTGTNMSLTFNSGAEQVEKLADDTSIGDIAKSLSKEEHLILICGHYEGFDERIRSICDMELSIGDYVLTGGELPSMVICDSVTRLIPGVIESESYENDSFTNSLLDYPTYTKPREYEGMKVPDVLLSGDHKKIYEWRVEEQKKRTLERRPDIMKKYILFIKIIRIIFMYICIYY